MEKHRCQSRYFFFPFSKWLKLYLHKREAFLTSELACRWWEYHPITLFENNTILKSPTVPFRLPLKSVWPVQTLAREAGGFSSSEAQWNSALHWCVNWAVREVGAGAGVAAAFSHGMGITFIPLKDSGTRQLCRGMCLVMKALCNDYGFKSF